MLIAALYPNDSKPEKLKCTWYINTKEYYSANIATRDNMNESETYHDKYRKNRLKDI
jgi:hypothetical protein